MPFEPDILRLGKAFGVQVQTEYLPDARDVSGRAEVTTKTGSGQARWLETGEKVESPTARRMRAGRMDLLLEGVDDDSELPFLVVLEIKNTDWDRQADRRVRVNVGSHRRQVWRYLEPLVSRVDRGEVAWVQAALVYPRRPQTARRAAEIEALLDQWGVTVLWYDELPTR